jgi:hypothetical protein
MKPAKKPQPKREIILRFYDASGREVDAAGFEAALKQAGRK